MKNAEAIIMVKYVVTVTGNDRLSSEEIVEIVEDLKKVEFFSSNLMKNAEAIIFGFVA